jgi:diguanylate cyclase (GGDEF)-like protein
MENCRQELDDIIRERRIRSVFQPIVSLRDGNIFGFEALSRITGQTGILNIELLFEQAVLQGRIWELEQLCRGKSLDTLFGHGSYSRKLFLNVNPLVIKDPKFKEGFTREYLNHYGIVPGQVIFEVTENSAVTDKDAFLSAISHYKDQNYEIALDDVGSCYSGLNLICDIRPHYIKLDKQLVRGLHNDGTKRAMVKSMTELADSLGMHVIAEGIEETEELKELIEIGVHYGQGFLLGRPGDVIDTLEESIVSCIRRYNQQKNRLYSHSVQKYSVGNISIPGETVSAEMPVEAVKALLDDNPLLWGVTVLEGERAVGIVTREKLGTHLSGRYGFSLYQKKPISLIMEKEYLAVEETAPISRVSSAAMERSTKCLYDFIVITKEGRYQGIVTIKELLQKTMESAVAAARLQSPLTGLPGNLLIEEEIERTLQSGGDYTIVYFDLDNFKAFNDVYGFEKGDLAIKELARVLKLNTSENDFVGHIGGDDFTAIYRKRGCENVCRRIVKSYEERVRRYYSERDRQRGYIEAVGRNGRRERFPLLSVTAAAADSGEMQFSSVDEITKLLALRKKELKAHK